MAASSTGSIRFVALGVTPDVDWLADSGLEVAGGVRCDASGQTSVPGVYAVGDVAQWRHPLARAHRRIEHWRSAGEQAAAVAATILVSEAPTEVSSVPYFWSDQYDVKIQCLGEPIATDTVHVVEDDGRKFLAYYERDGVVAGVVGGGMPGKVMKTRAKIAAAAPISDVLG